MIVISEKENTHISKFLSLVLRHKPDEIGLALDDNGWADVAELITKSTAAGIQLTPVILEHIVASNAKKRFAFNEAGDRIRANQGHSVNIELALAPVQPPPILFHGTADRFLSSIMEQGLLKQERQHVHLSADIDTAISVGRRHGRPVVLEIEAMQMFNEGHEFFLSDNGVWLTDRVPKEYLSLSSPKIS